MRIISVRQLKPIQVEEGSFVFPNNHFTRLVLDKKSPAKKKEHQLIYQQDLRQYGTVGDCCKYLSNEDLIALEEKGMISIKKAGVAQHSI